MGHKSAGPASHGLGGPASLNRSGETSASSIRSGGRASSASSGLDREGGDDRMEHRRSQGEDCLPSPGKETAVRRKRRRTRELQRVSYRWIPKMLMLKFNGDARAALKAYNDGEGNELAPMKGTEEESIKQNDGAILKKGCLDDADVLMAQSALRASCSSSRSGDAQEEEPFDVEETSLRLKMDNKPEHSCSRDCGNIAQDEDEGGHSGKKIPPAVEDEHSVHAIEEHKQEQGSASEHVQVLLDMDDETVREKVMYFCKCLRPKTPECGDYHPPYDREELIQLFEQLALYRIKAYELTVDRKLAELSYENLKLKYPASKLYDNNFFKNYEERLEWYFDPERSKSARYDNYQRLVLRDHGGFLDWEFYCTILNTYEEDLAYVKYFEEVANKTKWIEDYLGENKIMWERIRSLALMQALEIATSFSNVSRFLVTYGFREYIHSVKRGYFPKGLDALYFEIWKRVAKEEMSFKAALLEIDFNKMFPNRSILVIKNSLGFSGMKNHYDAWVAGIDKTASDDKARQLIREALRESVSRPKYYLDYARRKLDIADDIELVPKGRRLTVAPLGKGDDGYQKEIVISA